MTGTLCPNTQVLSGLGRELFDFPFWKWITRDYSYEYTMVVQNISRRANYNANRIGYSYIPGFTTYETNDIARILDVYGNSVLDGTIPEYDENASRKTKDYIYDVVAQRSNMNRELVKVVLFELYWAVNGNPPTLYSDMVLNPKKFKENQDKGYAKPPITAGPNGNPIDDLRDTVKTILILGAVGLGAYALTAFSGAVKAVKQ